jgi:hypothetical protein
MPKMPARPKTRTAAKKKSRAPRRPWTPADDKLMKSLAGKKSAAQIAKALKRTAGAVWQRASTRGVSLALR